MKITKKLAVQLVKRSKVRKLDPKSIQKVAQQMRAGNWTGKE